MPPETICLDFDGVIHAYTSPWDGPESIPDHPVPGAIGFIEWCLEHGYKVAIHSTRIGSPEAKSPGGGATAVEAWLLRNGFPDLSENFFLAVKKPPAVVYVDDRGFRFTGNFDDLVDFLKIPEQYTPWNKLLF